MPKCVALLTADRRADKIWGMDWTRIVRDLKDVPLTQAQIAGLIGVTQPTISDIERGAHQGRITFITGSRLIELWREKCAGGDPNAIPPSTESAERAA